MDGYVFGIDIGGTKIALGILSPSLQLVARREFPFDPSLPAGDIFALLRAQLEGCLADASLCAAQISSIGIGVPGIIHKDGRSLKFATNAQLLNDFPLCTALQELFPEAQIRMENDANAAAVAESMLGAGRGFEHMLYCTISTGVGCGIILNGRLFRGSHMAAGEIGHMILYPGGEPCGCGSLGCAEAYAGGANYPRRIRARIEAGEPTIMAELAQKHGRIDGRVLGEACALGDAMALEMLDEICAAMGLLFYNIYKLLNLDCYVLGGGLTNLGEPLFSGIRRHFEALRVGADTMEPVHFLPAHFSSAEIGVYGAALVARLS